MFVLLAFFGTSIILAIYKGRKPKPEPQYRNEQIKRINFDELDRKMKDNDRTLVVQTISSRRISKLHSERKRRSASAG